MVENFSELLEQSLSEFKYKEGQIIKGTVLSIVNDTVVVDVGLKAEGRIPIKEFHSPGEEHSVKVGDKYDVYLEKLENKEGEALLSRERARKEESWSNLEKQQNQKEQVTGGNHWESQRWVCCGHKWSCCFSSRKSSRP